MFFRFCFSLFVLFIQSQSLIFCLASCCLVDVVSEFWNFAALVSSSFKFGTPPCSLSLYLPVFSPFLCSFFVISHVSFSVSLFRFTLFYLFFFSLLFFSLFLIFVSGFCCLFLWCLLFGFEMLFCFVFSVCCFVLFCIRILDLLFLCIWFLAFQQTQQLQGNKFLKNPLLVLSCLCWQDGGWIPRAGCKAASHKAQAI